MNKKVVAKNVMLKKILGKRKLEQDEQRKLKIQTKQDMVEALTFNLRAKVQSQAAIIKALPGEKVSSYRTSIDMVGIPMKFQ